MASRESPKLETESKAPIESTYYAWSKKMKESGKVLQDLGVDCKPKRLDGESSPKDPPTPVSGSIWNAAGTWEEKDMLPWSKERIVHYVIGKCYSSGVSGPVLSCRRSFTSEHVKVELTELTTCDGHATIVYSKGKVKPGFDLAIVLKWKAEEEGSAEEGSGTLQCDEFCDTNEKDENEWTVKTEKHDSFHDKCKSCLKKVLSQVNSDLWNWVEELKSTK